jgi:hypothetical protein
MRDVEHRDGARRRQMIAGRLLELGGFVALGGWACVAVRAIADPERLAEMVAGTGLRVDTLGTVCFGLAGLLLPAGGLVVEHARRGRPRPRGALRALALLSTCGWLYIAGNAIAHPSTLWLGLTHFAARPMEIEFGLVCLIVSAGAVTDLVLGRRAGAEIGSR